MIVSKMNWSDNLYFRLHAEQTITSVFLDEQGQGIEESILTKNTLERIVGEINADLSTILDFSGIVSCQNNLGRIIIDIKNNSKSLVLINISKELVSKLRVSIISNPKNIDREGMYEVFYVVEESSFEIDYEFYTQQLFNIVFKDKLKAHILPNKLKAHTSSSVYLDKYVDVKRFISHDNQFVFYSIYILAEKIYEKWLSQNINPILVCQNSNGGFIASILSGFLHLDILILDKIGPINKLYTRLGNTIHEDQEYLVVSDLVCMGTEVKIVKNLIEFLGGNYVGNVSLIRTETLDEEHRSFDDTATVFSINKTNNCELGYFIYTNLEPLKPVKSDEQAH